MEGGLVDELMGVRFGNYSFYILNFLVIQQKIFKVTCHSYIRLYKTLNI